jgi:hypothetical protein
MRAWPIAQDERVLGVAALCAGTLERSHRRQKSARNYLAQVKIIEREQGTANRSQGQWKNRLTFSREL